MRYTGAPRHNFCTFHSIQHSFHAKSRPHIDSCSSLHNLSTGSHCRAHHRHCALSPDMNSAPASLRPPAVLPQLLKCLVYLYFQFGRSLARGNLRDDYVNSAPVRVTVVQTVGKSTLFNALTESDSAAAANFPFCTIEPNHGVVLALSPPFELSIHPFELSIHPFELSIHPSICAVCFVPRPVFHRPAAAPTL